MEAPKKISNNIWLTDGLIVGIITVILALLTYVFIDVSKVSFATFMTVGILIGFVPMIVLLIVFIKKHKKKDLGGQMSLKQGVIYGTLVTLVAAVVMAVYSIAFNNVIDTEYIAKVQEATMENVVTMLERNGVPDSEVDKIIQGYEDKKEETIQKSKLVSPLISIFTTTLYGLIISLIVSAIIKTKQSPIEEITENSVE